MQGGTQLLYIASAKKVDMHQKVIELVNWEPLFETRSEWPGFFVALVKCPVEAAKKAGHGQVHFPVGIADGRVKDDWHPRCATKEITTP